jgi:hypothetical protein
MFVYIWKVVCYTKKKAYDYLFLWFVEYDVKIGLDVSFITIYDWKGIRSIAGEINTKIYVTLYESSRWILNGRYTGNEPRSWNNVIL